MTTCRNILVPVSVIDSAEYKTASSHAKNMLIELAAQMHSRNNGELIATWSFLKSTGRWNSPVTAFRAKNELLELKLIKKTGQGGAHRPQTFALPISWVKSNGN